MLLDVIRIGLTLLCVYGLVDAVRRPATAFVANGKLTKPIWLGILVVSALVLFTSGILGSFLALPAAVAAIVYVVDVKPAVSGQSNPW